MTASASVGGAIVFGGKASGITGTSAESLEGRVEYLLRESERAQHRLNELEHRSEDRAKEVAAELRALREELVSHVDTAIDAALDEYAAARQFGLVALGLALVCWVVAAFA